MSAPTGPPTPRPPHLRHRHLQPQQHLQCHLQRSPSQPRPPSHQRQCHLPDRRQPTHLYPWSQQQCLSNATLTLGVAAAPFTLSGGGAFGLNVNAGGTMDILGGNKVSVGLLAIGQNNAGTATVLVDASSVSASLVMGKNAGNGNLTLQNGATGSFTNMSLTSSTIANSASHVTIQNNSHVTDSRNFDIGTGASPGRFPPSSSPAPGPPSPRPAPPPSSPAPPPTASPPSPSKPAAPSPPAPASPPSTPPPPSTSTVALTTPTAISSSTAAKSSTRPAPQPRRRQKHQCSEQCHYLLRRQLLHPQRFHLHHQLRLPPHRHQLH